MSVDELIKAAEQQKEEQIKTAKAKPTSTTNPPKKTLFDSRQYTR